MKVSKKIISILTLSILVISVSINTSNALITNTLTGSGRWETAIKISQDGWSKADSAILVNDNSIADALSSTPFAKLKNAPILLTQSNKLDARTKSELKRLGVKNVYLIGGKNTLDSNIENQLKSERINFERISGDNRYETSLRLAERLDEEKDIYKIVVVNGEKGLADAVSVGAAAAQDNMPIILSDSNEGTKIADKFIKEQNIKTSYIIGGVYSISNSIEQNLPNSKRISGSNRNETNAKVIQEFYKSTELKNLYVTKDGMKKQGDLIDSLSVGVLAAKNNSPLILVGKKLDAIQKDVLNSKIFAKITKVGGNGNEDAYNELKDLQETTNFNAENVSEFESAIKKSDANDIIKFKADGSISSSFKIDTKKAITVELIGNFTDKITVNMPNGDINIDSKSNLSNELVIEDIKNDTLNNEGSIDSISVYDGNGCRINNKEEGDIWLLTIADNAKNVNIVNDGQINKVNNSVSDTIIKNNGKINTVSGSEEPSISGKKPDNNTVTDSTSAKGISVSASACSPAKLNRVSLTISTKPQSSEHKIYYRVVSSKPSPMDVGDRINQSLWIEVDSQNSFEVSAVDGSYIEAVEVKISNNKVTKWGRTKYSVDDGYTTSTTSPATARVIL
ncbi:cell wall-binding repeat-containing protein [Clostridioides sp. ES-S-0108-01]|uniref:cell wall-binding repeat-containing protein n=1 Tax=Clostridioides sp. ES-S-0108-01 TaxID=2770773 RepID=UPI001D0C657F|nr:cell wall-binding repeat-containing protein [Clostridioides sp. ES-S-0108-01]UDN50442.1 cell wall-binding repeat-containing protein [Clostridioides sp. ES-S-0107-01]